MTTTAVGTPTLHMPDRGCILRAPPLPHCPGTTTSFRVGRLSRDGPPGPQTPVGSYPRHQPPIPHPLVPAHPLAGGLLPRVPHGPGHSPSHVSLDVGDRGHPPRSFLSPAPLPHGALPWPRRVPRLGGATAQTAPLPQTLECLPPWKPGNYPFPPLRPLKHRVPGVNHGMGQWLIFPPVLGFVCLIFHGMGRWGGAMALGRYA